MELICYVIPKILQDLESGSDRELKYQLTLGLSQIEKSEEVIFEKKKQTAECINISSLSFLCPTKI